ncbi:methyltransferase-like protein 22 isoform X1 [Babylonia areolata]|uniref:methyltransferase-like protein 22 isoform X1 n=1 Tax=Babylonia areolata TaxID=304850 RepID=UPI003FD5A0DD
MDAEAERTTNTEERQWTAEPQVLSDVHVHSTAHSVHIDNVEFSETRFAFKPPCWFMCSKEGGALASQLCGDSYDTAATSIVDELSSTTEGEVLAREGSPGTGEAEDDFSTDADGDLIVHRKKAVKESPEQVINIVHAMGTGLSHVGQQVWLGALLLCDFMLHFGSLLEEKVVIDLGAGAGLTSIVAAFQAATVFCTDRGDDILNLARLNVKRNDSLLQNTDIRVRSVDWTAETPLGVSSDPSDSDDVFSLSKEDTEMLGTCTVILAAEVVYDLDLTDSFFRVLYSLLLQPPAKSVYMTVEKRQVFTIADKDVVSPAYEHFRENLEDLSSVDEGPVRFLCSSVDLGFPQYFSYQRTKELELWKIEAIFIHQSKTS